MRKAVINRNTKETEISCAVNLEGSGKSNISTTIGFFDHMLEILSHHSLIDINLIVKGDTHVDLHHTVEDTGYALSQSILQALGNKKGIKRYGFFYIPMDECLSRCVLDFSGRSEFVWKVRLGLKKIGEMDTELFHEFFKAFANEAKCNLHIENLYGTNNHHIIESCFKAFARSLRISIDIDLIVKGDTHVDLHHTVEDTGYALSQSILQALGNKKGIKRYGFFYIPMDECLSRCVLDFSGRPELAWNVRLGLKKIGEMDTELFHEFFKAFVNEAKCNLHIENLYGKNNHHIIESCFKAFAKSLRISIEIDERVKNIIPSSKGIL